MNVRRIAEKLIEALDCEGRRLSTGDRAWLLVQPHGWWAVMDVLPGDLVLASAVYGPPELKRPRPLPGGDLRKW